MTACDTLGSSVQGKSEAVGASGSDDLVEIDRPRRAGEADAAEKGGETPAVTSEQAARVEAVEEADKPADAVAAGPREQVTAVPAAVERQTVPMSAGRTASARRRKRRAEHEVAAGKGILVAELAMKREARAKVLRTRVRQLIEDLRIPVDLEQPKQRRR